MAEADYRPPDLVVYDRRPARPAYILRPNTQAGKDWLAKNAAGLQRVDDGRVEAGDSEFYRLRDEAKADRLRLHWFGLLDGPEGGG